MMVIYTADWWTCNGGMFFEPVGKRTREFENMRERERERVYRVFHQFITAMMKSWKRV